MKLMMPWVCLAVASAADTGIAYAMNTSSHRTGPTVEKRSCHSKNCGQTPQNGEQGLNPGVKAYREANYFKALDAFSKQTKYDPVESYYLGQMNIYGYGQLKNNDKAIRYFTQSGEGGYLPAQAVMAMYLLLEKKDPAGAFYWFKKSADANNVQAQMYIASAYLFGFGVKKNPDKARQYYIGAAKQGNSIAQFTLAEYFFDSRQAANKKMGMIWLEKAAAQHNPRAQLLLGKLYAEGKQYPKSMETANQWVDLAVAQGYAPAMIQKGNMALAQNDYESAKTWYEKSAHLGLLQGDLALAQLYLNAKTPFYNVKQGYLLTLKAAQNDLYEAQLTLSDLYKAGKGIEPSEELAQEWHKKAVENSSLRADVQAAKWLSNNKSTDFASSGYFLKGIFADWKNPEAQKQNAYNPSPAMDAISRKKLYQPQFVLTSPNDIPISDYYDALVSSLAVNAQDKLMLSPYPFSETLVALKSALTNQDKQTQESATQMLDKIKLQASLGDSIAEFHLGQIYEYGTGVKSDPFEAVRHYELAANQEELPAMYALGLLYLQGSGELKPDYAKGMSWMNRAAFKGDAYAQFALAQIYQYGLKNQQGEMMIRPNPEQADGMYYLAAADNHGLAQYQLAEMLVRKKQDNLSLAEKQSRQVLIKSLYQGAIANGVIEAALPVAFYNAMETDKTKQEEAFKVAKREAEQGNPNAALLLGLLYDRGIGVASSQSEAMYWYNKSGTNLVSQFILGTYARLNATDTEDKEKGETLLQASAHADFPYAYLNLAVLQQEQGKSFIPQLEKALTLGNAKGGLLLADYYLSLASNEHQMKQARDIYQQFAGKGDKDAQLKLAFMYDQGLGGQADAHTALTWYNMSAEQGQPVAQYLLGRLYQLGKLDGMPQYDLAKQWYSRAQRNYSQAAVALGFIYDTVDDNYQQAKTSYDLAAGLHDPVGQYNLGLIYEEGKGQPVDYAKAKALYQEAADVGYSQAMVRLAGLYFNGSGVKSDPQQALDLYKQAAEKGNRDAYYQLGLLSEAGVTTKIDFASALHYYEDSAKLGSQQGMLAAARMYQYGIGVPQNKQQAVVYYEMLAGLGNAFAQYQLASLYDNKEIPEAKSGEGKRWLQEALKNGSPQANQVIQKVAVQNQFQLSFVEPISLNQVPMASGKPVELMYLEALNQWNCGDERQSKMIFHRIRSQFPNFIPARRMYERMSLG